MQNEKEAWLQDLAREGLDVEQGMLYCNGKEPYKKVMHGYCEDYEDSGALANQLFEKEDWKNYTIAVHGMKSAMRSIGAIRISDIAKELEFAGKEGRLEYIRAHHHELLAEYEELFARLRKLEWLCPHKPEKEERNKNTKELRELEVKEFEQLIGSMEKAMYELDEEILLELLAELEKYQYCGVALETICSAAGRKVEMCDYVSAVEMVQRFKSELENKEVNA